MDAAHGARIRSGLGGPNGSPGREIGRFRPKMRVLQAFQHLLTCTTPPGYGNPAFAAFSRSSSIHRAAFANAALDRGGNSCLRPRPLTTRALTRPAHGAGPA